ncbi:PRC-barrel domain-containing protein [Streptomyces sp. NBC_00162]|uniref:PRC-barrel domain-containing protein n=1 Tax=Streptomyces sp. NBC_00162 TaxID=2903629 RepID=UPI00214C80AC|nr:PRC-barrel domain-containing protein [Streptomyces sp. NBC_00162]UUU44308.1 PRC-barrel domain-containing protein [Streptomyces sp. NBC_00162]
MANEDIWGYRADSGYGTGIDLIGFKVKATDGSIGKVDEHTDEAGVGYLVVDTGVWTFGKHVLLPASTIERVDRDDETVYVNRTKGQIKDAPEFEREKQPRDPTYLEQFTKYYGTPHM